MEGVSAPAGARMEIAIMEDVATSLTLMRRVRRFDGGAPGRPTPGRGIKALLLRAQDSFL